MQMSLFRHSLHIVGCTGDQDFRDLPVLRAHWEYLQALIGPEETYASQVTVCESLVLARLLLLSLLASLGCYCSLLCAHRDSSATTENKLTGAAEAVWVHAFSCSSHCFRK